ncbi:MAG TPA: hypothetical protein VFN67_10125 [Polyangiales bacterium]|nr:hypothetical protein [Polyangiales bacterium]
MIVDSGAGNLDVAGERRLSARPDAASERPVHAAVAVEVHDGEHVYVKVYVA